MRQQGDVFHADQRFGHLRLELIDIQPGPRDPALLQRRHKGRLVHHIAARDVDEDTAGAHRRQRLCVDHVTRRRATGDGHHHEIRSHRFGHADLSCRNTRIGNGRAVVEHHLHPETMVTTLCDRLADPAQPDDAHAAPRHRIPQHLRRSPAFPAPGAQQPLAFARAPRRGQDQEQRDICGGIGHCTGRVGDDHARRLCRRHVDVVIAHAEIAQHPAAGRRHIGKDAGIKPVAQRRQHIVIVAQGGAKLVRGQHPVLLIPQGHVEPGAGGIQHAGRQAAGDQKRGHQNKRPPSGTS